MIKRKSVRCEGLIKEILLAIDKAKELSLQTQRLGGYGFYFIKVGDYKLIKTTKAGPPKYTVALGKSKVLISQGFAAMLFNYAYLKIPYKI